MTKCEEPPVGTCLGRPLEEQIHDLFILITRFGGVGTFIPTRYEAWVCKFRLFVQIC